MKTSNELIDNMKKEFLPLCVVGEVFYIQLFINFNVFKLSKIYIDSAYSSDDKLFWSDNIELSYIDLCECEKMYMVYCGLDNDKKNKYPDAYDFFDDKSIFLNGTFDFEGNTYIVDDVKYVASNPDYMKRAYPSIRKDDLYDYLQELVKAPAERRVDNYGQICLKDYFSKYINQRNGRRITINQPDNPQKIIHVFGDSRVSGYMLEDRDLFSNVLQQMLIDEGNKFAVINYGIPGREIDRMEYQVSKADISKGDIVFVMTGCYEYRENSFQKQLEFVLHLKRIKKICDDCGAKMCYINLPVTVEMVTDDKDVIRITGLYRNYKFHEYSYELVEKYKRYMLSRAQFEGIYCYDMASDFNCNNEGDELLFINMHHYSPKGNLVIANALCKIINSLNEYEDWNEATRLYSDSIAKIQEFAKKGYYKSSIIKRTRISIGGKSKIFTRNGRFRIWIWMHGIFREILKKRGKGAVYGAIVMNANPFTKGHRYLVEYASKQVDHLYVFVLAEDKSEFAYDDRLKMVYSGCRDLKNVSITSGGVDVISSETFPEYFMKKELQDAEISAYKDIEKFATVVAPSRMIKKRFVGEEPFDNVTKQYNEQMKKYLPRFGIEIEEIPRLMMDGFQISASKVRKCMATDDWETIKKIVPISTYKYLKKMK